MSLADAAARSVTFLTDDSVHLRGTYWEGRDQGGISLLLIHDFGSDRTSWEPFVPLFRSRGWSVLTFDLRGHGESLRQDMRGDLLEPDPILRSSQHAYPADVRAAVAYLQRQPKAAPNRIALIGVGLGGDLGYAGSGRGWGGASTVCISLDESRARELAGTGPFSPRSIYLLYGDRDTVSLNSASAFAATAAAPAETKSYPTARSGMPLWTEQQPEIIARSIAWIERTI